MTHRPATRVDHGAEHGRDAAGRVGQRKKIREVEFADHREMLLHGYRIACTMSPITVKARSAVMTSRARALRCMIAMASTRRSFCSASVVSSVDARSEEHTSELQSLAYLVCRLLL